MFGRRIATAIFHVSSSADIYEVSTDSLKDSLEPEVKHLQGLITSYLEDPRFQAVDFQYVHSRVGFITVQQLVDLITDGEKKLIVRSLKEIELSDGTVSDDEDIGSSSASNYRIQFDPEFPGHLFLHHSLFLIKTSKCRSLDCNVNFLLFRHFHKTATSLPYKALGGTADRMQSCVRHLEHLSKERG